MYIEINVCNTMNEAQTGEVQSEVQPGLHFIIHTVHQVVSAATGPRHMLALSARLWICLGLD